MTNPIVRTPYARKIRYGITGAPVLTADEMQGSHAPGVGLAPRLIELIYSAARDGKPAAVAAAVTGEWTVSGRPADGEITTYFGGDPSGWPAWLAEEVRLAEAEAALAPLEAAVRAGREAQQTGHRPVALATPCASCSHPYNWHASRAACEFGNETNRCGCTRFVPGERPEPVSPWRILGAAAPTAAETGDRAALRGRLADTIRKFPFDNFGLDDVSYLLESDPATQEWVPKLADAVLAAVLSEPTDQAAAELASLAVNAGRALQDEKRHYQIACEENARLRAEVERLRADQAAVRATALREAADGSGREAEAELYVLLRKSGEDRHEAQALIDRHRDEVLRRSELRRLADEQPTTPTTDPIPLRWGLDDIEHGDDDTATVLLSGPDGRPYWLELAPDRANALREALAGANEQPAPTGCEAWPPLHRWRVETFDGEWSPGGTRYPDREDAAARFHDALRKAPAWKDGTPVERRIVRETTTYTVEPETAGPAAPAKETQPTAGKPQDQTAISESAEPRPCRTFVSGGTVWCCEEGETDCPCVCHLSAADAAPAKETPTVTVHAAPNLSPAAAEALDALVDVATAQMASEAQPDSEPIVAYRSLGGRILRCLDHVPPEPDTDFVALTAEDLPDGGICTYPAPPCGRDVLTVAERPR